MARARLILAMAIIGVLLMVGALPVGAAYDKHKEDGAPAAARPPAIAATTAPASTSPSGRA